jgi:hypothetical protein
MRSPIDPTCRAEDTLLRLMPIQAPDPAIRKNVMRLELLMSDDIVHESPSRLWRYRFMFRVSLVVLAASVLLLVASMWISIGSEIPPTLLLSLVMIDLAIVTGYKILTSTMRILDAGRCSPPRSGDHAETRS